MNKSILTIFISSLATFVYGQNKFSIKIYQNTDFFKSEYNEGGQITKVNNINFSRASLALEIHTKKNFAHAIEFLIPELSKSVDDIQYPLNYEFAKHPAFDSKASSYSLRYELIKTLTDQSNRFTVNLGLGLNPYYIHIEYIPNVENAYYRSDKFYGAAFNVTPGMTYKISNRFSVDLNIPLKIYDLRTERKQIKNPGIPIRQQTMDNIDHIYFENAYTIRLGLAYRLKA